MTGITDRSGWAMGLGFAALWIAAAFIAGGTTFHLGPFILAGAVPMAARSRRAGAAAVGVGLALIVGIGLLVAGRMDGPSLLPWGGAFLESMFAAFAGGLAGYAAAVLTADTRRREPSRA